MLEQTCRNIGQRYVSECLEMMIASIHQMHAPGWPTPLRVRPSITIAPTHLEVLARVWRISREKLHLLAQLQGTSVAPVSAFSLCSLMLTGSLRQRCQLPNMQSRDGPGG